MQKAGIETAELHVDHIDHPRPHGREASLTVTSIVCFLLGSSLTLIAGCTRLPDHQLTWDAHIVKNDHAGPKAPALGTKCKVRVGLRLKGGSHAEVHLTCEGGFRKVDDRAGCNVYEDASDDVFFYRAQCIDLGRNTTLSNATTPTPYLLDTYLGRMVYYGNRPRNVPPPEGAWRMELKVARCSEPRRGKPFPPGKWDRGLVGSRQFYDPDQTAVFADLPQPGCPTD